MTSYAGHSHLDPTTQKNVDGEISPIVDQRLSKTSGIDVTMTSTTDLYTVPSGGEMVPLMGYARLTAAVGLTVPGIVSIGTNDPTYDDLSGSITINPIDTTEAQVIPLFAEGNIPRLVGGTVIKLKITTPWIGTSGSLAIDIVGYLTS